MEGQRDCNMKGTLPDIAGFGNRERWALSPGLWAASKNWKRQRNGLSPRHQEGISDLLTPWIEFHELHYELLTSKIFKSKYISII